MVEGNIVVSGSARRLRGVVFKWSEVERCPEMSEMDEVEMAAEADFRIQTYSWQKLKLLVAYRSDSLVVLLRGFAGPRTAEIARLDWGEMNLDGKLIEVKAKMAKTPARRLVPIVPSLMA